MPALDALAREFRERGVTVIGLSADDRHDRRDALKAAEALSYSLGMLSDAHLNDFGAPRSLPLTYVIGADGAIRSVLSANRGAVSAATLRAAVIAQLPVVEGAPPAPIP
jgi:peroxiredoxin